MMKLRATLFLALALIWAGLAVAADYEAKREEIAALGRELNSVERAIPEAAEDDAKLVALRVKLENLSKALIGFGVSLRPRLTEINNRLAELGTPPKEGEPAEPQVITEERRLLTEEKAVNNGLLGEAESTLDTRCQGRGPDHGIATRALQQHAVPSHRYQRRLRCAGTERPWT